MTPRDAEVAFLLEGIPGVLRVYAVRGQLRLRWAVHHDGTRALATAHYALRRALSYDECERVGFSTHDPATFLHVDIEALVLDAASRAAASGRIAALPPPAPTMPLASSSTTFSILIVDPGYDVARAVVQAYGPESSRAHVRDEDTAVEMILTRLFDLVVCTARSAYGPGGLLPTLRDGRARDVAAAGVASAIDDIIVLVPARDEDYASAERAALAVPNIHVHAPLDADLFRVLRTPVPAAPWIAPLLRRRQASAERSRRVLVIDEHEPEGRPKRFTQVVARGAWAALDELQGDDWDLVICSATMRLGTQKLYRALWDAHPAQKRRFAFLVDDPDPTRPRLIGRPLREEAVEAMLDRIDFLA